MSPPRLYLSAAHKSSGKTTLTVGLCAALRARGMVVQPFKKGPDYIDPIWHGMASGHDCHNLDFHTMGHDEIRALFQRHARHGDVNLIEGNKGLYDGIDIQGRDSNAAMAQLLQAPVILILDTRGITRGIVPLLLGYQAFEPRVDIAGVLLNRIAGSRHEAKLRAAIEHYTDTPILGAIPNDGGMELPERHLGLVPGNEFGDAGEFIDRAAQVIESHVMLDRLIHIANAAPPLVDLAPFPSSARQGTTSGPIGDSGSALAGPTIRIGIPRDPAFGFYYPDDLAALRRAGAELVSFNTLSDTQLPPVDALFIGGGFPEVHMEALQANAQLRGAIRTALDNDMPAYAECGGLMYLTRGISWQGKRCEMVGALPAETIMHARPQGRGYVVLRETGNGPWSPVRHGVSDTRSRPEIKAHEFHHAQVIPASEPGAPLQYAYHVLRGHGIDGRHDGIVYRNLLAGFSHLRSVGDNHWARAFVDYIRKIPTRNCASYHAKKPAK
uniref:Cobyrinate a,c-diamide synthase n=1 Tax=Candidatus Kentrum sp. MB TaxID=2138164 RepID=A0A450XXW7_9GAMM|nr:MAG: cobyrinic acid a,c-diamide synthase [Candidatus Kentron sp. MB]VFK34112.1 MAG: cobyrinic acid a,c-diamide synthase [Candidatus Kentron sp. MB]VFK76746.1 MAG: cobyrinic acid a,c-diamide synthase [Candidatus Kentron sp. MB]